MKKDLDKRGTRRMLVTTLGRIERLTDIIDNWTFDSYWTPKKREEAIAERDKEHAKLKMYNAHAAKLLKEGRA